MGSEISVIVIVVISIALAVFNNNKAKGSQTKQQNSNSGNQGSIREVADQLPRNTQRLRRRRAATSATSNGNKQEASKLIISANQQPKTEMTNTDTSSTNQGNPSDKSQIEEIVEDFTMEKAVIYSEILNPKFKEY